MNSPDTVTEALTMLAAEGYEVDFQLIDGELRCDREAKVCSVSDVQVERLLRFEGTSDPGDEMVVFGLHDPGTGTRGTLVSAYGMDADPELLDHLKGLQTRLRPT